MGTDAGPNLVDNFLQFVGKGAGRESGILGFFHFAGTNHFHSFGDLRNIFG